MTSVYVNRVPFSSPSFQGATATLNEDGSVDVLYADPDAANFEDVWEHFKAESWRYVDVLDARGYPLFSFVSPAARADAAAFIQNRRTA